MERQYEWDGRRYEIAIEALGDDRYRLRWGGEELEFTVRPLAAGSWSIGRGEKSDRVFAHADGEVRQVWLRGKSYPLRRIERRRSPRSSFRGGAGSLRAEMPCQIVKILVPAGVEVPEGEPILQMEAMKMELQLSAPDTGRVVEWLVAEGQIVQRGAELLKFESAGG